MDYDPSPVVDETAWGFGGESSEQQERCFRTRLILFDTSSGATSNSPMPCKTWGCRNCGKRRLRNQLTFSAQRFQEENAIWVASCQHEDRVLERLKKRAQREKAQYLKVRRVDGLTFWFSTTSLNGHFQPSGKQLDPPTAYEQLRTVALKAPGIKGVTSSARWKVPATLTLAGESPWKRFGLLSPRKWESILGVAAQEVERRYGVELIEDLPLPPEIKPSEFLEILYRAKEIVEDSTG